MKFTGAIPYTTTCTLVILHHITGVFLHPVSDIETHGRQMSATDVVITSAHRSHEQEQQQDVHSLQQLQRSSELGNHRYLVQQQESHDLDKQQDSHDLDKQRDRHRSEQHQRSNTELVQLKHKNEPERKRNTHEREHLQNILQQSEEQSGQEVDHLHNTSMAMKSEIISLSKRPSIASIRSIIHELQQIEMYYQQLLVRGYLQESDVRRLEMLQTLIERLQNHLGTLLNAEQGT